MNDFAQLAKIYGVRTPGVNEMRRMMREAVTSEVADIVGSDRQAFRTMGSLTWHINPNPKQPSAPWTPAARPLSWDDVPALAAQVRNRKAEKQDPPGLQAVNRAATGPRDRTDKEVQRLIKALNPGYKP